MKNFKPLSEHIGKKIKDRRQRACMTLLALAQKLEVSAPQLEKYEQGINRASIDVLYKLSQIFKVSVDYFFQDFIYDPELATTFIDAGMISIKNDTRINILIVEDNPADQFIIRKFIEECPDPSNIYMVYDGEQALQQLRSNQHAPQFARADFIILDLNIPKKDGYTVLKEIKRDSKIQDIPVIIFTDSLRKEEMIESYRKHASGYICKSSNLEFLRSQIQALVHYWSFAVILPRSGLAVITPSQSEGLDGCEQPKGLLGCITS